MPCVPGVSSPMCSMISRWRLKRRSIFTSRSIEPFSSPHHRSLLECEATERLERSSCPLGLKLVRYQDRWTRWNPLAPTSFVDYYLIVMTIWFRRTPRCSNRLNVPRASVALVCVSIALLSFLGCNENSNEPKVEVPTTVLNVKDFGAKGDGQSDDYDALQAAASALCQTPNATMLFPEGTYRIGRHRVAGGPKEKEVQNIRYVGCKGN